MKLITLLCLLFPLGAGAVDLVRVDKSERRMYLIDDEDVIREYRVALGANPKGHKREEGDQRTPEGIYVLDYVKNDSSFYKAMHISYPNLQDTEAAAQRGVSPGGFIMVHGQGKVTGRWAKLAQMLDWTDGCIALSNSEMDEFLTLVEVGTPIHIEW